MRKSIVYGMAALMMLAVTACSPGITLAETKAADPAALETVQETKAPKQEAASKKEEAKPAETKAADTKATETKAAEPAEEELPFPVFDLKPTYEDIVVAEVDTEITGEGTSRELKMNIYNPKGAKKATPAVIYVHGGKWSTGDYTCASLMDGKKENGTFLACMNMLNYGCSVVTADYRLSQEASYPAMIWDLKGQIRFLRAHADEYKIDPDRIIVWGESAGGQLVNILGTTDGIEELEGDVGGNLEFSSKPTAVVDYFGMTEILQLAPDQYVRPYVQGFQSLYDTNDAQAATRAQLLGFGGEVEGEGNAYLRGELGNPSNPYENPEIPEYDQEALHRAYLASALNFVSPDDCPFFICQGGMDFRVAMVQSERLFDALTKAGVETYMFTSTLQSHGNQGPFADDAAARFVCNQFGLEEPSLY
jgi:acetyl esterase/lipase